MPPDTQSGALTLPSGLIQFEVRSGPRRGPEHEAQTVYGRTDHRNFERARSRVPVADLCRKHGDLANYEDAGPWSATVSASLPPPGGRAVVCCLPVAGTLPEINRCQVGPSRFVPAASAVPLSSWAGSAPSSRLSQRLRSPWVMRAGNCLRWRRRCRIIGRIGMIEPGN
jgi:hypothetical protein